MTKILKNFLTSLAVLAVCAYLSFPQYALAANKISEGQNSAQKGGVSGQSVDSVVPNIVKIAMFIIGALSVILIVISGIMYATAAGDEAKVKKAKKALIGAIIGLAIALLAYTIVSFVDARL
jgi:amino acid transporter